MRGLPLFFLQKDLKNKHEQDKVMIFCLFLQYHCKTNRREFNKQVQNYEMFL